MIDCLTPCCTCCRTSPPLSPQETVGQSTESPPPSPLTNIEKTEISTTNMNNQNCESQCNVQETVQPPESLHSETENNNLERLEEGLNQRSVIQNQNSSFKRGRKIRDFESTSDFGNSSHNLLSVKRSCEQKSDTAIDREKDNENETRKNESSQLSFSIAIDSNDENEGEDEDKNENENENENSIKNSSNTIIEKSIGEFRDENELFGVSSMSKNVDNYTIKLGN